MSDAFGHTLGSTRDDHGGDKPRVERPALYRLLEADRPTQPPRRHTLGGVAVVEFGRGDENRIERVGGLLRLRIADRWMSSNHARLELVTGRWLLTDHGSKNGTRLNGRSIESTPVADGDLIELGHCFFLFRIHHTTASFDDLDGAELREPALATLSPTLAADLERLSRLATTPVSILILGESGTGKEVTARALHALSGRPGPFVGVNCGALPDGLIESELFGHKKGAFSGAADDHVGLVRTADRGTLFLDEVGDLPLPSQATLLRVLQEREVRPVGGTRSLPVDIRLLSATHRDLDAQIEGRAFRVDLLARIAGYRFTLPAVRNRREDLGMLIAVLMRKLSPGTERPLDVAAARALLTHSWPLNIRELENCLTTALALAGDGTIELEHLGEEVRRQARGLDATAEHAPDPSDGEPGDEGDQLLRQQLTGLLGEHGGNISAVARAMGKDRKQVHRWLKRLAIDPAAYRR